MVAQGYTATLVAATLAISRSSLYYQKKPRGSRADRYYDEQIVLACGEKLAYGSGGLEEWWTRFDECKGIAGVLRFFGLLFDTSRNWRDNLQLSVPGYRDRVVHIGLDPAREGGLNFDMTEETIAVLTDRGAQAGAAILARYAPTSENPPLPDCVVDLENQKWIRFRSLMELLEETVISVKGAFPYAEGGEPSYVDLLHKTANTSYNMGSPQRRYARELLDRIMDLAPAIDEARVAGHSFGTKAPKPEPELRVIPKF
jgi:hypothetical protein